MNAKSDPLSQMEIYLGGYLKQGEPSREPAHGFVPSVTVSRQAGSRGERIVSLLAEELDGRDKSSRHGWAYFDRDLVKRVLDDHELPESIQEFMPEDAKSPITAAIEEMLSLHPSEWTLFQHTADTIRKLCRMGGAIIVGRGGNFIAADLPNTYHVRVIGSLSRRVRYLRERDGLDAAGARAHIREVDRGRERFVKKHLFADINDPAGYHVVINTDDLSDELAAEMLAQLVLRWSAAAEKNLTGTSLR